MTKLSLGRSNATTPSSASRPPPAKKKTIFDDSDGEESPSQKSDSENVEAISTLSGGLHASTSNPSTSSSSSKISFSTSKSKPNGPPKQSLKRPPQFSSTENLASKFSSAKQAQAAEELDPSIYDYDGIYDAMKAPPVSSSTNPAGEDAKPKYMSALKAAAEVRKRDQVRALDRKTAREREAEGDEFKDKETFVTGAYKRQQEELRRLEEEEKVREAQEEERRRAEGGGMKGFYKSMLERDEERHRAALRAVEEGKGKGEVEEKVVEGKGKSEAERAREMGVAVNEEGEVVDKRELLKAGLNAADGAKVQKVVPPSSRSVRRDAGRGGRGETQREKETREFEEQLLGKHGISSDEEDGGADVRASKSRKMEDELLAGLGSP